MTTSATSDLRRWSEAVARDPGSLEFVQLADAYRRQGRHEAALRVCLRGLERRPTHVPGHELLARLYLEAGDRQRACDEWSTVLRLDPSSFEAHRGMGFYYIERRDLDAALRHLEQAEQERPGDRAVREGLRVVRERLLRRRAAAAPGGTAQAPSGRDPARVFDALHAEAPFLGALILDARGLVLAGALVDAVAGRVEALGATVGAAIEEAGRTATALSLGAWHGLLLEFEHVAVHLAPLSDDATLLLGVARDTPAGWVLRTAARARELATTFLRQEQS